MIERNEAVHSERPQGTTTLEARLCLPEEEGVFPGVLLCHPHPSGGGDMEVPLLKTLSASLCSSGRAVMRFNFAGVGNSGGVFTDGAREPGDVSAAWSHLCSLAEVDSSVSDLAGWSFGAWMCLQALVGGLEPRKVVAVSPPLAAYDWGDTARALSNSPTERHYLAGSRDRFCPVNVLNSFTAFVSEADGGRVHIIDGADHFFTAREKEVADVFSSVVTS